MKLLILSNPKNHWLLPGFQILYTHFGRKLWGMGIDPVIVSTGSQDFELNQGFRFHSVRTEPFPANRWSNFLIKYLEQDPDTFYILMLEDYWMNDFVSFHPLEEAIEFMEKNPQVLRFDLSSDRKSLVKNKHPIRWGETLEVFRSPHGSKYQMSFQAGIWNGDLLSGVLSQNESPWESEINGTQRLNKNPNSPPVWGNTFPIIKYKPVYRSKRGTLDLDGIPLEKVKGVLGGKS